MEGWIIGLVTILAAFLFLKMAYVMAIGFSLPRTKGAVFVGTPSDTILKALYAVGLRAGELLADLGCGDGRVLVVASRDFGARSIGYEINLFAYFLCRFRALGCPNMDVQFKNFWGADLGEVDVVFCYLFPDVMERLSGKLKRELRPGARAISCNFPLPQWTPSKVLKTRPNGDPVYL